jgi:L-lysine exporter family protein LysE/ArgO
MTSFLLPRSAGLLLGGSLIIAIGAQNAFILRQGLLRQHVFILCLICALSDAALIGLGVAGLGAIISGSESADCAIVTLGGAAFLAVYAFLAFLRAISPSGLEAAKSGPDRSRRR